MEAKSPTLVFAYNHANGYAAIWTIAFARLGPPGALLEHRADLFRARDLYVAVGEDDTQAEEQRAEAFTNLVRVMACTGPSAMVRIPVNVATVDGWKTNRTGLDSSG
jgi:hypothetical protein